MSDPQITQAKMNPLVSVVIPVRPGESLDVTMESLQAQTIKDMEYIVTVDAHGKGQSWARNQGISRARGDYILFSDSDIAWVPDAVERLVSTLNAAREQVVRGHNTVLAYGPFEWRQDQRVVMRLANQAWSFDLLKLENFIPTMALINRQWFRTKGIWFDDGLRRLEDWDLWLQVGFAGGRGVRVKDLVFTTQVRQGLSWGMGSLQSHNEAEILIRRKHGI